MSSIWCARQRIRLLKRNVLRATSAKDMGTIEPEERPERSDGEHDLGADEASATPFDSRLMEGGRV